MEDYSEDIKRARETKESILLARKKNDTEGEKDVP